jgi:hypothetical protein
MSSEKIKTMKIHNIPEKEEGLTEERVLALIDAYVNSPGFRLANGIAGTPPGGWAIDGSGAFTTGQPITSNVADGTAPLIITSTTFVANLNVDQVDGYDLNQSLVTSASPTFNALTITTLIIGTNTVSTAEWANLDGLDQSVGTTSNVQFNDAEIDGALNHDGTTAGFYGIAPVTRPAAYTQTYATADKTLGAYTADDESGAYTQVGAGADTVDITDTAKLADLNALRTAVENLRALVEDSTQMLNSVVDDLQASGLLQ